MIEDGGRTGGKRTGSRGTAFYIEALLLAAVFTVVILTLTRVFAWSGQRGRDAALLTGAVHLAENGAESSYASCDFGRTAAKEPALYERILEALGGERAYVEGLPWERRRVYHRLDSHMREILALLVPAGLYQGELFFLKTGERIRIAGDREGRGSDVVSKRFF